MNRKNLYIVILIFVYFLTSVKGLCQESIFTALKSDSKRADKYFHDGRFPHALELYLAVQKKNKSGKDLNLKIARTYYRLKNNENTVAWYNKYRDDHSSLPTGDDLIYAEALSSSGKYKEAIQWYKKYLKQNPKDKQVSKKIWRLNNMEYLYEDSAYYSVEPLPINSKYAEFGPGYFQGGLVFVSNRKEFTGTSKIDGSTNTPFQALYYSKTKKDTLGEKITYSYSTPMIFSRALDSKFHQGICAFFPGEKKMIYTKSSLVRSKQGGSTLQLFLAELKGGTWKDVEPFAYNSPNYSICHPSLSVDGKTLFFSSDMPGGYGGKDIYKCLLVNEKWTKPENLGDVINTPGDDSFPFYHQGGELYFASTGHPGLGGLDIFRVKIHKNKIGEVQNAGYPVNTSFDDFGIVLNTDGTRGFLSSNRNHGGFDDDIFALEVDLQTYPLTISGILKLKSVEWQDSSKLAVLPYADLYLIDNHNKVMVYQTTTDSTGHFALNIPYSSQYKIKVFEKDIGQKLVSLEIPKSKKLYTNHQIVIVKERFRWEGDAPNESTSPAGDNEKKVEKKQKIKKGTKSNGN